MQILSKIFFISYGIIGCLTVILLVCYAFALINGAYSKPLQEKYK